MESKNLISKSLHLAELQIKRGKKIRRSKRSKISKRRYINQEDDLEMR
jgi:hypothetical protein